VDSVKLVKKQKGIVLLLFLAVMLIPLVSSAQTTITNVNGYQIFYPQFDYVKQNSDFKLHLHVSNISTGLWINNSLINCRLHLYNATGQHTYESGTLTKDANWYDFEVYITSGNFTSLGLHAFYIWCYSADFGGEAKGVFEVTPTGEELTTGKSILNLGFLALLILLFIADAIFFGSMETENKRNEEGIIVDINNLKYLKGVLFAFGYALLIAIFFIASNLALGYLSAQLFGKVLFVIYRILFLLALPVVVLWLIWLFVSIFQDRETKNLIERGVQFGGKNDI
jgi:hypothetical protein